MSALREQILARIAQGANELGYRPPTLTDFIYATRALFHDLQIELAAMLSAGIIDTQNGDSGLTYIKSKAPYVAPEKKPSAPTHESIAPWPRKSVALISPSADCMDKYKRKIAATKERIRAVMTQPMTAKQYAKAAGIKLNPANQMLQRYAETGFLAVERKRPFCYRLANPC